MKNTLNYAPFSIVHQVNLLAQQIEELNEELANYDLESDKKIILFHAEIELIKVKAELEIFELAFEAEKEKINAIST